MDKHVTTKELSKRLYDLGVRVESEFYWHWIETLDRYMFLSMKASDDTKGQRYPALLSSELGELLLEGTTTVFLKGEYTTIFPSTKENIHFTSTNMAESIGLMLEYLLVNGLIEL